MGGLSILREIRSCRTAQYPMRYCPKLARRNYNWFTEGCDTADLKDAKALLNELARVAASAAGVFELSSPQSKNLFGVDESCLRFLRYVQNDRRSRRAGSGGLRGDAQSAQRSRASSSTSG